MKPDKWIEDKSLLPCPFCGNTDDLRITDAGGNGSFTVRCCYIKPGTGCGADSGYYEFTPERAAKRWNKRMANPDASERNPPVNPSKAELLASKWMAEQISYPNDPEGQAAATAVRLCAKELLAVKSDEPAPSPEPYAYIAKTIGGGERLLSADDAKQYVERDANLEPLYRHAAPSPTKPEGLEWREDLLFFNGYDIGSASLTECRYQFELMGEWSQTLYTTLDAAKSAAVLAARSWLSPVSDTSDTVILGRREANLCRQWFDAIQDLNDQYLETEDAVLAVRLYRHLGIAPSKYLLKCAESKETRSELSRQAKL